MSTLIIYAKVCTVLLLASLVFCGLVRRSESRWLMGKPLAVMVLAFPLAFLTYNIWLLLAAFLVLLPIIARSRGEAAGLYVVSLLCLPVMGQTISVASSTIINVDSYMALSAGLILCSVFKRGESSPPTSSMHFPVLALLIIEMVAAVRGLNATSTARAVISQLLSIFLPYYAMTRCISSQKDVKRLVIAFCFAVAVQAVLAVYEARMSWPIYEGLQRSMGLPLNISQATKLRAGFMRANGTLPESTSFAWVLALALAGTICVRPVFRSTLHFSLAVIIMCSGLLVSQGRAGWLAGALSIVLIDIYRRKISLAVIKAALLAGAYATSVYLERYYERLSAFASSGTETYNYRVRLLDRGLEEIYKHPLWGTDAHTVMLSLSDLRQGEGIIDFVNAYIYFALVTGVVGVAIFTAQFVYVQMRTLRARGKLSGLQPTLIGAWVFAVSGFTMVTAYTSGFGGSTIIFYLMVLAIGSRLELFYGMTERAQARSALRTGPAILGRTTV